MGWIKGACVRDGGVSARIRRGGMGKEEAQWTIGQYKGEQRIIEEDTVNVDWNKEC